MAVDPSLRMVGELAEFFDLLFVLVIVAGTGVTLGRAIHVGRIAGGKASYLVARRTFGKVLLLALEVLIAADLLRTVSLSLTVSSVLALGLLVVVRTILSFAIQIEMEGDLPWRVGRPGHRAGRSGFQPDRDPHEVSRAPGHPVPGHRLSDQRMPEYRMPES
ncbi:DUF1622 domain-containing protein [Cyanobium sp. CH-040]|uniref:DUF1622 domain-containing protein n=1 Tax=Cyanobium sp. CH-040 TaxID=2823708 RepID=UPI0020CCD369|nr:DUF1622 domain-containing protein [Cyanobium sp. CH-040]MCP9929139.1 DUF1622 domain-containing protein [Cyanobium sp. CH-040]